MSKVWFNYDEAIKYMEKKGILCDDWTFAYDIGEEGEYALDLLDDSVYRLDENNDYLYRKSTLDLIVKQVREKFNR